MVVLEKALLVLARTIAPNPPMAKSAKPLIFELTVKGLAELFCQIWLLPSSTLLTLRVLLSAVVSFSRPLTIVSVLVEPPTVTLPGVERVKLLMVKFAPSTVFKLAAPLAAKITELGVLGKAPVSVAPVESVAQLELFPPFRLFHLLSTSPFQ